MKPETEQLAKWMRKYNEKSIECQYLEAELKLRSIEQSCVPCASIDGDCCGVIYWENKNRFRCNECGRLFRIKVF